MEIFEPTGNWDNHKVLLELALEKTKDNPNPILELGCGDGSSPCLIEYERTTGRKRLAYDFSPDWAKKWGAVLIENWDSVDWNRKHSVALVDESPAEQRHKSIMLLKDTTDIVVVHDTEPLAQAGYLYDKIWHYYKYKVDLVSDGAWATAMSNTIDLNEWVGHKKYGYEVKSWDNRNKLAFVCVAFGDERYVEQQARLKESILKYYPFAPLFFWTNEMPPDSKPFLESLYGFKPHAVRHAFNKGYRRIVFLDPAMIVNGDFETLFHNLAQGRGVVAIKDDSSLSGCCSNKSAQYFGYPDRLHLADKNLVGGSVYYFDFNSERCKSIFNLWSTAEVEGQFGSQEEASAGKIDFHRNDETIMALAMIKHECSPIEAEDASYCVDENSLLLKKHFK